MNTKTQSNEVVLEVVQTNNKLFKKEIAHLKEDTRTLLNKTRSTEISLEKVQSDSNLFKERFNTLEKAKANLAYNSNSFKERFSILEKETADLEHKTQSWQWVLKHYLREFTLLNVLIGLC